MAFLCIDGSEHSERAFNFYMETIHRAGDELNLVHIHVPPNLPPVGLYGDGLGTVQVYAEAVQGSVKESKAIVERYKELCRTKRVGCKAFLQSIDDSIGHAICDIAQKNNAKLIVIGQRGLGKIRRTLFGSVSDYVLHHVHIPVIVVPPEESK